jgi:ribonuclease P protein component
VLSAPYRLRKRGDFAQVYAKGARYRGQYFVLRVYPHPKHSRANLRDITTDSSKPQTVTPSRIGIVISKKVAKLAVSRNRIKRQVRAIFCQVLSQLSEGLQIIVTVSTIEESPNYGQLCNDLINLLKKAGILHGD